MNLLWLAILLAISPMLLDSAIAAESVDPDNDGSQYAYAANLGWINAEPLGDGGPGLEYGASALRGWLWSANTGWISLSCENTSSCGTVEYRVSHDGSGNLSGYGWSPNVGWISFSCSNTSSCGGVNYSVTINTGSGEMGGYAYAANAGWISFSCTNTGSCGTVDFGVRIDTENAVPELIFEDGFEGS
jgi:hypothetical protein